MATNIHLHRNVYQPFDLLVIENRLRLLLPVAPTTVFTTAAFGKGNLSFASAQIVSSECSCAQEEFFAPTSTVARSEDTQSYWLINQRRNVSHAVSQKNAIDPSYSSEL